MQSRAALPVPISVMVTTLLLVYCTLFRVNPIPVAHDRCSRCKWWTVPVYDTIYGSYNISPVHTTAQNQFKLALELGYTTDFTAHNFCSYVSWYGLCLLFHSVCIRDVHSCSGHAASCPSAAIDINSLKRVVEIGLAGPAASGPIICPLTCAELNAI